MLRAAFVLFFVALTVPACAGAEAFTCCGDAPGWRLRFGETAAHLQFPALTEMVAMNDVAAEGGDWPRAFILIGDRDTAIALLEREPCSKDPDRVHVLTQRGQTPLLLTGCCRGPE